MPWTLFLGGTVVDGAGSPRAPDTSVLVGDYLIHSVGRDLDPARLREEVVPRGETLVVIDATGKTVMPGLIDAHCHFSFGDAISQEAQDLYTNVELRTLRAAWNAKAILRAGVTSISQPDSSYGDPEAPVAGLEALRTDRDEGRTITGDIRRREHAAAEPLDGDDVPSSRDSAPR